MKRRASAAALCVALLGCAVVRPWPYRVSLAAGDRALLTGRFREAAEAYDRAATETRRPLDRDEALYRAAQAWRRSGDVARALQRFDWIAQNGAPEARDPRAALEAGRLRLANGQREEGEADLTALVLARSDLGPARRAVTLVLDSMDGRDASGTAAMVWIDRVLPQVAQSELASPLWLERARRNAAAGNEPEARRSFEAMLAVPYPRNAHWDDGGLLYARTLRRWAHPREALAVLDRLLGAREVALLVPGSYERPSFAAIELERAELLRDELHELEAAAEGYHRVYERHRDSRLRDDALAAEASVWAELGQLERACERWRTLASEFGCTRFGREAVQRLSACAGGAAAARPCADRRDAGVRGD